MLTYEHVIPKGCWMFYVIASYKVKLDGKHIGNIKQATPGSDALWYYQPKGSKLKGDTMTLAAVKCSLELPEN